MEQYRSPVLFFVIRAREEFLRSTRLKVTTQTFALDVIIGNQRDGDTRVPAARVRLSNGKVCERIELPDPEAADLTLLKHRVWTALYRSWLVSLGNGDETVLERLPAWLTEGAARRMDTEIWPADVDRALLLWSRACLPAAAELLDAENPAIAAEPAIASVLADYLMNRRLSTNILATATHPAIKRDAGITLLDALARDAAKGQAWSVEHISKLIIDEHADIAALDADLDLWLASLGRKVLVPGLTTKGTLRRFRASLLIYPSDYGKFFNHWKPWVTFQELAASADPAMKRAAAVHALQLQTAAVGRDNTFRELAETYTQFLMAVASGKKKPAELMVLLMNAEAQRKGIEEALTDGRVLQDK